MNWWQTLVALGTGGGLVLAVMIVNEWKRQRSWERRQQEQDR